MTTAGFDSVLRPIVKFRESPEPAGKRSSRLPTCRVNVRLGERFPSIVDRVVMLLTRHPRKETFMAEEGRTRLPGGAQYSRPARGGSVALGLIPAPEIPEKIAGELAIELHEYLDRHVDDRVYWSLGRLRPAHGCRAGSTGDPRRLPRTDVTGRLGSRSLPDRPASVQGRAALGADD